MNRGLYDEKTEPNHLTTTGPENDKATDQNK
jgi:hypothetical protein